MCAQSQTGAEADCAPWRIQAAGCAVCRILPEEVMRPSTTEVRLGKVLYLGVSDTPAWVEARMQILTGVRR